MKAGDVIIHTGSRERFVVTDDQTPIAGREHQSSEEVIYASNRLGQRIPLYRFTVDVVSVPLCGSSGGSR